MELPEIISGNAHTDVRGTLSFNNEFDMSQVRRFYTIENADTSFVREWQGHKIEQRWFSAVKGSFEINLVAIDDWEQPSQNTKRHSFVLESGKLDVLHVPKGYVSSIKAREEDSKLLVMADYRLGEIKDEYRFESGYFK